MPFGSLRIIFIQQARSTHADPSHAARRRSMPTNVWGILSPTYRRSNDLVPFIVKTRTCLTAVKEDAASLGPLLATCCPAYSPRGLVRSFLAPFIHGGTHHHRGWGGAGLSIHTAQSNSSLTESNISFFWVLDLDKRRWWASKSPREELRTTCGAWTHALLSLLLPGPTFATRVRPLSLSLPCFHQLHIPVDSGSAQLPFSLPLFSIFLFQNSFQLI